MASHSELSNYIDSLSPTAYWKMTEASGTFAQTGSSTAAALTPTGNVFYQNQELIYGDSTKFATFDPSSYANGSRGDVTVPALTLSASAIVYFTPPISSVNLRALSLSASGETEATNFQLSMQLRTDDKLSDIHENGAGVNVDAIASKVLDPRYIVGSGSPLLYTLTRDNSTKITRFYVNGVLLDQVTYTTAPSGGTSCAFVLGQHPTLIGNSSVQPVSYGHVCYFQRVLTDAEVYGIANAAGLADAPLGNTRFDANVTLEPTLTNLEQSVFKTLLCSLDPLIDISVAFPEDAYRTEE